MSEKIILDNDVDCEQRLKALKAAEERLELALEAAHMGAFERDLKTNKVTRSKTHLRLLGYDQNTDPDSQSCQSLMPLEDRENFERILNESIKERRDIEIPVRIMLPEGKLRWVHLKGRAIYDENGNPARLLGVSQDITKCVEHEEQLRKQADALAKYSSVVAHDLKTPLQSILLNAQLMIHAKNKAGEKVDKKLEAIVVSSRRMANLIDDLLLQAKLESKKNFYTDIDSSAVIEKIIINLSGITEVTKARISVNNYLPVVSANPIEFSQLFQNIVSNSLKYRSNRKPEVEICAREIKNYWLFSVRDNGIGIDPKNKDKIFESFERLSDTKEIEGSGLGLSICKKIVDRAGGKIWVQSELGLGSTFNIAWPKVIQA